MADTPQTLFGDAYVRCPACAAWMPNRADACTECGYQPALGHALPLAGYAAVRFIAGMLVVLGMGFAVAYAHKNTLPELLIQIAPPADPADPDNPEPTDPELAEAPQEISVRSRSYVDQFVRDYMTSHLPVADVGDTVTVPGGEGQVLEATLIQIQRYRILVEFPDGSEARVPFIDLDAESRIRCDEPYRRQFQRRETERLWRLRNQ